MPPEYRRAVRGGRASPLHGQRLAEAGAVFVDLLVVGGRPFEQGTGDLQQACPERGEGVLDARRYLGVGGAGLGLDLTVITPELTHALTVPAFSELLPLHQASLADSHEQARKLAETFQAAA